mgnify:FL=1
MQSAMCIPLWPARNASTAHLVMCPFAGGSSSAFRRWRDHPMAEIALSLVTWPGRDRLRHLAPLSSITQLASLLADELEESVSPDAPLLLAGHSMGAQAQRPR